MISLHFILFGLVGLQTAVASSNIDEWKQVNGQIFSNKRPLLDPEATLKLIKRSGELLASQDDDEATQRNRQRNDELLEMSQISEAKCRDPIAMGRLIGAYNRNSIFKGNLRAYMKHYMHRQLSVCVPILSKELAESRNKIDSKQLEDLSLIKEAYDEISTGRRGPSLVHNEVLARASLYLLDVKASQMSIIFQTDESLTRANLSERFESQVIGLCRQVSVAFESVIYVVNIQEGLMEAGNLSVKNMDTAQAAGLCSSIVENKADVLRRMEQLLEDTD